MGRTDISRQRFAPRNDFSAVLVKQGAVLIDSDVNELMEVLDRRRRAETVDTIGRCVVPAETPAGFAIRILGHNLTIGPGRLYAGGHQAQNHGLPPHVWNATLAELEGTSPVPYDEQPYFPDADPLPEGDGPHLVYLDVWRREVTYLERPDLVEKAVGVDTTSRWQTVWQVRVLPDVGDGVNCATEDADIPGWLDVIRPSAGRLTTSTFEAPDDPDPCLVPPAGGYKEGANVLFRVEVHSVDAHGDATFKWARHNATVATAVRRIDERDLQVERVGRDADLRFRFGDWIEITSDTLELAGRPGIMRRVVNAPSDADNIIRIHEALPDDVFPPDLDEAALLERHTRVVRWDQKGPVRDTSGAVHHDLDEDEADEARIGVIPAPTDGTELRLEDGITPSGITVSFSLDPSIEDGRFRPGDFWVFAGRSADASVEQLTVAPPRGIHHHYCRLAVVTFPESVIDCRRIFQPLSQTVLRIRRVETAADNQVLPHNGEIRATGLRQGVNVVFSAPLSEDVFGGPARGQLINPAVALQVYLPEPPFIDERQLWGLNRNEFFGFRPVVLAGTVSLQAGRRERLQWQPSESAGRWLQEELFSRLTLPGETRPIVERLLCVLRVRGDFIWSDGADGTRVFLDGETTANPVTRAGLDLPSGNGTPGGSFVLSFWLVSAGVQLPLVLAVGVNLNVVSGTVSRGGGPVEAATVRLRRTSPPAAGSEQTTQSDAAGQFSFTALPGEYTVIAESLGDTAEQAVEVGPVIVAPGGGAPVPGGPGDLSVVEISGIGPVFRELLAAHGISRVREFVSLPPDRIAEILPVSVERARTLIANARRLIEE